MPETTIPTPRRSRAAWEQLIAQYEVSGIKQRAFCEQNTLSYSTFCYWRKKLRQTSSFEHHSEPVFELPMLPIDGHPDWRVELDLGRGIVLRLK